MLEFFCSNFSSYSSSLEIISIGFSSLILIIGSKKSLSGAINSLEPLFSSINLSKINCL